jgi:hypothetical protein
VVYAVLDADRGLGGKRVAKLAAAGELPAPYQDLGPFVISARYVQELVSRERRRRDGKGASTLGQQPPKDAARSILAAAFDAIAQDLAVVKRKKRGADRSASLAPVLRATREAIALERAIADPKSKAKPSTAETPEKPKRQKQPATPADQLAARIRADTTNGNRGTDSEGTSDETGVGVSHGPSIGTSSADLEAEQQERSTLQP